MILLLFDILLVTNRKIIVDYILTSHWPLEDLNEILDDDHQGILVICRWAICCKIALRWLPLELTD